MDLIALAVPFFLLALLVELAVDRWRGSGFYRTNDAINSLSAGALNTTSGYFTKLVPLVIWGFVLERFAIIDMPLSAFDVSATGVALWLLAAIGWDFCYYWFHRFSHEVSILWAAHAVHHQSEDYNLSTALRQTSTGFLFGWIFYLPLFVLGFPLEVLVTVNAINLIYQFWVHTQIVGRLGVLDRLLVTPSNHRVHHAQNAPYIDKNYGGMFIVWDRLFGTFEEEREDEPVVYGVRKPLASWNPFWANLQVYDYLLDDARRTRRWQDKIGIWFRRTGWRPDDVEKARPRSVADLKAFRKFDPPVSRPARRYVLAQFGVAAVATVVIGVLFSSRAALTVLLPCSMLWALLLSIGWMNEGRRGAIRSEVLRLLLFNPLVAVLMGQSGIAIPAGFWLIGAVYTGLSLVGLYVLKSQEKSTNCEGKLI